MIATYNWPQALALVLRSALRQSLPPDEIVVADDGSGPETRRVVEAFAAHSAVPVRHVWHPDEGFRLAAIRNRAVAEATGDYVVQIDGDVILHRHFLRDHAAFARRGSYVSGSRLLLDEPLTRRLLDAGTADGLGLWTQGVRHRANGLRMPWLSPLMAGYNTRVTRGCNMAFWRDDIVRVNGYDESFRGWGAEDAELSLRLRNAGVEHRTLKFAGIVYHLYHPERSREGVARNEALLEASRRAGRTRCDDGMDKYLISSR